MSQSINISTRNQRIIALQRVLLLVVLAASAAWFFSREYPPSRIWENQLWLATCLFYLGLWFCTTKLKQHHELLAWVALITLTAVMAIRLLGLYLSPAFINLEAGSALVGAYGYFPMLYLLSFILLKPKQALIVSTMMWAILASSALLPLLLLMPIEHEGVRHVLPLMLVGQPISIFLLSTLPKYEQHLRHTAKELGVRTVEAATDHLSGLLNRRGYEEQLTNLIAINKNSQNFILLAYIDIDHFKPFNDKLGHIAGDNCIRRISSVLNRFCQKLSFSACRIGGDEFAILGSVKTHEQAVQLARELQRDLNEQLIPHPARPDLENFVTVSIGLTITPAKEFFKAEVLQQTDMALYQSKAQGRNQLIISSTPTGRT